MLSFTAFVFFAIPFLLAFTWDRKHREQGAKGLWRLGAIMILFGAVLVAVLPNPGLLYCGRSCAAGDDPQAIPLSALVVLLVVPASALSAARRGSRRSWQLNE